MAKCHFKQDNQHVPTAVITGLDLADGILINNNYPLDNVNGTWAIVGARVMITRFWSASSATVMLAPNMPDERIRSDKFPKGIGLEDDISIWLGYIDQLRPVTLDDLKEGRLIRTFTGIIENLKDTQTMEGVSLMLQARDRAKWFLDSSIWFSAREIIASAGTSRADLILDIANKSIGATKLSESEEYTSVMRQKSGDKEVFGRVIRKNPDYFIAPTTTNPQSTTEEQTEALLEANLWYMNEEAPLASKLKSLEKVELNPEFRIISTRLNLETSEETKEATRNAVHYLLAGNQPMEVLKGLSMQEIYPMEIFQSQHDGNLYYVPRGNDSSGLKDPERFNRQYFFRTITDVDPNKRLIALRTEVSSIGLKTNFIVSKQAPNTQETYDDYVLHLMTQPSVLRGKSYAPKLHKVYDPTIKTALDAALIAVALARVWSKEVDAALTVMLGDPSIVPGEILQVYGGTNSINSYELWKENNKDKTLEDYLKSEVDDFIKYDTDWNKRLDDLSKKSQQFNTDTENNNAIQELDISSETQLKVTKSELTPSSEENPIDQLPKLLSPDYVNSVMTGEELGFSALPKTIYRVEAIIHKYNLGSKGFSSELALVSPFAFLIFYGILNILTHTISLT